MQYVKLERCNKRTTVIVKLEDYFALSDDFGGGVAQM